MRICILAALTLLLASAALCARVSVGILRKEPPSTLTILGPCVVQESPRGERVSEGASVTLTAVGRSVEYRIGARLASTSLLVISPARSGGTVALQTRSGARHKYRGRLRIRPTRGALSVVNLVDIEDYVRSVLPSEMPCDWPAAALAAQAVVARSYVTAEAARHHAEGFSVCDLTHCQVYRGADWERPSTDRAVAITRGLVLAWNGRPVPAPFHSTCGGHTTDGLYAGRPSEAYLSAVSDRSPDGKAYCAASLHATWTSLLTWEELRRAIGVSGALSVTGRDQSGRSTSVCLGRTTIAASTFMMDVGRRLGWNKVKSTLFSLKSAPGGVRLTGRGLGHGMGLCQWGARGMALAGKDFRAILRHYYPKCAITRLAPSSRRSRHAP